MAELGHVRRGSRYAVVSVITVVVGQVVLFGLFAGARLGARLSYVIAFAVSAALSYVLNRRWTWGRTGRSSLMREVLPYWLIVAATLVLATWAAGAAESATSSWTGTRWQRGLVVSGAAFTAIGVVWILRYLAFGMLFRARSAE